MNKNVIELGKNNAIVTNENGEVTVIKANDSSSITDILVKENEIEDLTNERDEAKKELEGIDEGYKSGPVAKLGGLVLIATGVYASIINGGSSVAGSIVSLCGIVPGAAYVALGYSKHGTRISRNRKRRRIAATIENTEKTIQEKQRELDTLKSKAAYETTMDEPKQLEEAPVTITYDGTVKSREFAPVRVLKLR